MTKEREALKLALDWLVSGNFVYPTALRTAIEEALAQPEAEAHLQAVSDFGQLQAQSEQEPVMEYDKEELRGTFWDTTSPKRKEWDGLNWGDLPEEWVGDHKFFAGATWAAKMLEKKNK